MAGGRWGTQSFKHGRSTDNDVRRYLKSGYLFAFSLKTNENNWGDKDIYGVIMWDLPLRIKSKDTIR